MAGKKRKRAVFVNDPGGDMSIASTATNRRLREEQTLAPPRSPEKRAHDNFDYLMGYADAGDDFPQVPAREGPAAIKIRAKRYENSVCVSSSLEYCISDYFRIIPSKLGSLSATTVWMD